MADIRDSKNWGFETKQLHIGQEKADPVTDARAVPIYASTSYVFHNSQHAADRFGLRDAGNIYGRLTNPTEDVFEQRIAALEGGVAALAVASGAAAINYTFQALAKTGEHIVASKTIYGGTYNLLAHTLPQTSGITATHRRRPAKGIQSHTGTPDPVPPFPAAHTPTGHARNTVRKVHMTVNNFFKILTPHINFFTSEIITYGVLKSTV